MCSGTPGISGRILRCVDKEEATLPIQSSKPSLPFASRHDHEYVRWCVVVGMIFLEGRIKW